MVLCVLLVCAGNALGDKLEREVGKAFSRIGIGPHQTEAYSVLYEKFLKKRNAAMRKVRNRSSGEEVGVKAKKAARRAAKKSVKEMADVLTELQLKYYEEYLEAANKLFLREAGLR